jgi:hypothetical protein
MTGKSSEKPLISVVTSEMRRVGRYRYLRTVPKGDRSREIETGRQRNPTHNSAIFLECLVLKCWFCTKFQWRRWGGWYLYECSHCMRSSTGILAMTKFGAWRRRQDAYMMCDLRLLRSAQCIAKRDSLGGADCLVFEVRTRKENPINVQCMR